MNLTIHNVEKIEFCSSYSSNCNHRAIRVTDTTGASFEIALYGNTDILEALPKAADFRDLERAGASSQAALGQFAEIAA